MRYAVQVGITFLHAQMEKVGHDTDAAQKISFFLLRVVRLLDNLAALCRLIHEDG